MEMRTLDDAIACITLHFTEPEGFIAQLERGEPVHEVQVQAILSALQRIHQAWQTEDVVPKRVVRLLSGVISRVDRCALRYPEHAGELYSFTTTLLQAIDSLFSSSDLAEEYAIALVCQHVFGTPSFIVQLSRGSINDDALQELCEAVTQLAQHWKHKEYIPKSGAHAVVNAPQVVTLFPEGLSTDKQERLDRLGKHLGELVTRCLSD